MERGFKMKLNLKNPVTAFDKLKVGDIFIDSESPVRDSDSFQIWLKTDFESAYCLFSTCSLEGTKEFFYIMPDRRVINFSSLSTQILRNLK
tara:strand:- start:462 stop:734 length:273 start_codon:yes stop_codon:yes gene_type:complete